MRLWHYKLISYLPRQQLIAQWRECCAIANNLASKGTLNHLLVNKIIEYPISEFVNYTNIVLQIMRLRKYKISDKAYLAFYENLNKYNGKDNTFKHKKPEQWEHPFKNWHNDRYLKQCLYNLQEKYDCGEINKEEWKIIEDGFNID